MCGTRSCERGTSRDRTKEGVKPQKPNIELRGLDIGEGKKRLAGYVVEPYWIRYMQWSKEWEG